MLQNRNNNQKKREGGDGERDRNSTRRVDS